MKMKKKVLFLIILSAILLLVGWTQIGKAISTQESKAVVSESNSRMEIPDNYADGKLFIDKYLQNAPSIANRAPDYRLDADFFNDWYRDGPMLRQNMRIPDYPMDGKFFADQYTALP
jgi:hypothetical protein